MIYVDPGILIYAIEDLTDRGDRVRQSLSDAGDQGAAIGSLVMLECLVGPLRSGNQALHDHYLRAFDQFRPLDHERNHYVRAAELRARHNLRTPDALHLATAQLTGCDELWTNDDRLAAASGGLAVDVLADRA